VRTSASTASVQAPAAVPTRARARPRAARASRQGRGTRVAGRWARTPRTRRPRSCPPVPCRARCGSSRAHPRTRAKNRRCSRASACHPHRVAEVDGRFWFAVPRGVKLAIRVAPMGSTRADLVRVAGGADCGRKLARVAAL